MRLVLRSCVISLLIASLAGVPAMAATESAVGMVVQAQGAQLEATEAVVGATVYPGDKISTGVGGSLRLKVGGGQIYLHPSTQARLAEIDDAVQASITTGTMSFSTSSVEKLQIETPVGVVRAAPGKTAYGQVSITGPKEMIITAYTGDLEIDYLGQVETITAGNSYRVDLVPGPPPQGSKGTGTVSAINHHLVVKLITLAVLGTVLYFTWVELSESPSKISP